MCTIQSLDPQLLRAILASESHQLRFKKQKILLDLLDTISIYLTTLVVTLAAAHAVNKVIAHGLEERFLISGDEVLRQKWLAVKELIHDFDTLR